MLETVRKLFFCALTAVGIFLVAETADCLSIFPVRQTVAVNPGEEALVEVLVRNDTDKPVRSRPEVDSFSIDGESGRAIFGVQDQALSWVGWQEEQVDLLPGERGIFKFIIRVPDGAEPGSHYVALFARTLPSDGEIGVGSRVGSLLFLHVAGELREELIREGFGSDDFIYTRAPIDLTLKLRNVGTTHVVPRGTLLVENCWDEMVVKLSLNSNERKVLPHTGWVGRYAVEELDWRDAGPLKARVFLNYGISNQIMSEQVTIWYLPWPLVAVVCVVVFLFVTAALIIVVLKKRR